MSRSDMVPFIPGENPKARHVRRLGFNLSKQEILKTWCRVNGISLAIYNSGHHWVFRCGRGFVEWWPSTAKLCTEKDYVNDRHVHDYQQVVDILRKHFGKEGA